MRNSAAIFSKSGWFVCQFITSFYYHKSHLQTIILLFCPLSVQLWFMKSCHFISLFPMLLSYKLLCCLDCLYFALFPHVHPNIVHNTNFSKNSYSSCTNIVLQQDFSQNPSMLYIKYTFIYKETCRIIRVTISVSRHTGVKRTCWRLGYTTRTLSGKAV